MIVAYANKIIMKSPDEGFLLRTDSFLVVFIAPTLSRVSMIVAYANKIIMKSPDEGFLLRTDSFLVVVAAIFEFNFN